MSMMTGMGRWIARNQLTEYFRHRTLQRPKGRVIMKVRERSEMRIKTEFWENCMASFNSKGNIYQIPTAFRFQV